jgi:hypothetical protein
LHLISHPYANGASGPLQAETKAMMREGSTPPSFATPGDFMTPLTTFKFFVCKVQFADAKRRLAMRLL